jgi:hypothetical protein
MVWVNAHDSTIVVVASASCAGCGRAWLTPSSGQDRAEARERGRDRQHQHRNPALVLVRSVGADLCDLARAIR